MKKLIIILALATALPMAHTGCATVPSGQASPVVVQTLLSVGQAAEAAITLSAQLYDDGRITGKQARDVLDFYTLKFQPVFRVAAKAAQGDFSKLASPEILSLGNELFAMVVALQTTRN